MDAPAASSTTSSPIADFFDLLAKRHDTMRTSANVQRADKERRAELTKALRLESEQFNGQDERALLIYGADEALSSTALREAVWAGTAAAKVDITFADTAFDALFRPAGARLTRFQQLTRGTRVRVVHDRQAVLAAFEAQDDVLGLPDDWEASLGCDFIVENYDNGDSTYVLVKPGAFDETSATNAKDGKWWPYSVVVLLP